LHLDENLLSKNLVGRAKIFHLKKYILTWGRLYYILDADLQSKQMLAKWEPRSRLGVYLGHSPSRAGSIALVLNPKTLHVSPYFHVVIDEKFSTVPFLSSNDVPTNWINLVRLAEHS